jgi:hypothetical protein
MDEWSIKAAAAQYIIACAAAPADVPHHCVSLFWYVPHLV